MSINITKALSEVVDYISDSGKERDNFEDWMQENSPELFPHTKYSIAEVIEFDNINATLSEGDDIEESKVDEFALMVDLDVGQGNDHIYPKMLQLEKAVKEAIK
jgi:hypothetical protein